MSAVSRTPLVSVVLATRDRATRLPDAIGSILAQTLQDLEVIVVDHASTDTTREVVEGIAERDPRVHYEWVPALSSGPSAARNRGLDLARGEYVSFIDDDDLWMPTKAETQVAVLRSRPELGGVSCYFEEHDELTGTVNVFRGPTGYSAGGMHWGHFTLGIFVMVRRADYGELRFDETLVTCEDWDLWLRCFLRKPIDTVPEVLYRARFHSQQAQASVDKRLSGYTGFISKHTAEMSRECLAYHGARLAIMRADGVDERLAAGARVVARCPPKVTEIIVREFVSTRIGRRTGDPGRRVRTLNRFIEGRGLV